VPPSSVISALSARAAALADPALSAAGAAGALVRRAVGGVAWGEGGPPAGGMTALKVVNVQRYFLPWPLRCAAAAAGGWVVARRI
jgi:hypothetical protein